MYRALLKTRLHFVLFCVTIEWRHTRDGNLMHTSCWEDKQTQGAILLLGAGDPVGCAANGSYVAGLQLGDLQLLIAVLHFGDPISALLAIKTYSTWQRSVNLG